MFQRTLRSACTFQKASAHSRWTGPRSSGRLRVVRLSAYQSRPRSTPRCSLRCHCMPPRYLPPTVYDTDPHVVEKRWHFFVGPIQGIQELFRVIKSFPPQIRTGHNWRTTIETPQMQAVRHHSIQALVSRERHRQPYRTRRIHLLSGDSVQSITRTGGLLWTLGIHFVEVGLLLATRSGLDRPVTIPVQSQFDLSRHSCLRPLAGRAGIGWPPRSRAGLSVSSGQKRIARHLW